MNRYESPFAPAWLPVSGAQATNDARLEEDADRPDSAPRRRHFLTAARADIAAVREAFSGFT